MATNIKKKKKKTHLWPLIVTENASIYYGNTEWPGLQEKVKEKMRTVTVVIPPE